MKLLSYQPDADPLEDGALLECFAVVPTYRGIAGAPTGIQAQDVSVLPATCQGAASLTKLDGGTRTFAGTQTKLYEAPDWSDVSDGTYATVLARWEFAQYGNVSLAVAKEVVLQASATSGPFGAVTSTASGSTVTAPAAACIEVVNDFVFLADTTGADGGGDEPDRWIASAMGDYEDWTPDIGTQCVTGRLTSVPGKIVAARKFGDQIVLYKQKGFYIGSYVGPPIIWSFPEVPSANTGTFCQESVINLGTPEQPLHFFVGPDDFYLFDGARPVPIGKGVKERFFSELNIDEAHQIVCVPNRRMGIVRIHYPSGGSASLNACLIFNYRVKRWGRDDRTIEFAFEYLAPGVTYDGLGGLYATYDSLPDLTYDEAFSGAKVPQSAYFSTSHVLHTLTGSAQSSGFTTSHYGDDGFNTLVSRLTPRWITRPSSGQMENGYWMVSGDGPTLESAKQMIDGRFDLLRTAAWHQFTFTLSGNWEVNAMRVDSQPDGEE